MRLKNKVALITGAGSGIGRAVAILFAEEGASVAAADMTGDSVRETVESITAAGGDALALTGDVTDSADAERMVGAAVESFGKLDLLVNSAGITSRHSSLEGASPEEAWERVIEVNLKGTYLLSWYAVPVMEQAGGGSIVNLASTMGLVGYPVGIGGGFNPYPPSKGGVVQFTKTLAVDSASKNIRVNCLCPGFIETNLTSGLTADPDMLNRLESLHPMGRLGQPREVAYAALYLASDDARHVTGTALTVDGGYTAW
jgi:NAD(P)-dependent dehydrogenase (short-subunit alcohol dehydrogenase family)